MLKILLDGSTAYVIKGGGSKHDYYIAKGTMSFPPTPEEIDEELMTKSTESIF